MAVYSTVLHIIIYYCICHVTVVLHIYIARPSLVSVVPKMRTVHVDADLYFGITNCSVACDYDVIVISSHF